MNTIIIHFNNRIRVPTLMHELNAALISPVSKWYRKPTPWWVDGFEEEGLSPIVEEEEEEDAMIEEEDIDEEEEDVVLAGEDDVFVDTVGNNGIPILIVTSPSDGDLVHIPETVILEFDHEDIATGAYKNYLLDASLYNWYMRFYSSTLTIDSTAPIENDNIDEDLQTAISTSATDEEQDILEMTEVQNMLDANEELVAGAGVDIDEEVFEMLMEMLTESEGLAPDTTTRIENDNIDKHLRIATSTSPTDEEQDILETIEVQNMVDADEEMVASAGVDIEEDEVLKMLTESEGPLQYHLRSSTKTGRTKDVLLLSGMSMTVREGGC